MKYIIGATIVVVGIFLAIFLFALFSKKTKKQKNIHYSQSRMHVIVSNFISHQNDIKDNRASQSRKRNIENNIKVLMMDNSAYWIKDNTFYTASIDEYGIVDKETTRVVDTMAMTSVELDKMLFIMDKLREGLDNDSGSTGK